MKKKYVDFIDNGGYTLFPLFMILVVEIVTIGSWILIGITFFLLLMLIVGYYTFKPDSFFKKLFVRRSIKYRRISTETDAIISNTRISITAIGNLEFESSNMTVRELYESLTSKNDCYVKSYFINGIVNFDNGLLQFTQSFSSLRIDGFRLLNCMKDHSELFDLALSSIQNKLCFYDNRDLVSVSSPLVKNKQLYLLDLHDDLVQNPYLLDDNNLQLERVFREYSYAIGRLFTNALLTGDDYGLNFWHYPEGYIYGTISTKQKKQDIRELSSKQSEVKNSLQEKTQKHMIAPNYKEIRRQIEKIEHEVSNGCTFSIISISKWENVYKKEILSLLDADKSVSIENQDRIMQILSQLLNDLEVKANHEQEEKIDITISALEKIAAMDGLNDEMDIFSSKNTGKADS